MNFETVRYSPDLERWLPQPVPILGTDKWLSANHSEYEWQVFDRAGRLFVKLSTNKQEMTSLPFKFKPTTIGSNYKTEPGKSQIPSRTVVRVIDGWLIGADHGEWGGRVTWLSPDGTRQYKISDDQLQAFSNTKQGLFAIQGLSHLGMSNGTLLKLFQTNGRWTSRVVANLKEKPYQFTEEADGNFLVVTSSRLIRVSKQGRIEILVQKAFWQSLYPNSLVRIPQNGGIYIGMRHGVARVRKSDGKYQLDWFLPSKEYAKMPDHLGPAMKGNANSVEF